MKLINLLPFNSPCTGAIYNAANGTVFNQTIENKQKTDNWINKCVPLSKYNMDISKAVSSYSDYYYKKELTGIILHMGSENERQH